MTMAAGRVGIGLLLVGSMTAVCCGSNPASTPNVDAGAGASQGGVPGRSPCDAPNAFPLWGKAYDAERDCIDTETHTENVGCSITPEEGAPDWYYTDGFSCLRRLADGQEFWVFAFKRLGHDPAVWGRCPDAPILPPKGCYAAACPSAPRSTCSLEQTKKWFGCSATTEFDADCCGRQPCEDEPDVCAANEQCVAVGTLGQIDCWDNPNPADPANPCDCGGPYGGPGKMLCMPIPEGGEGGQAGR
jgi:hypothetical protein